MWRRGVGGYFSAPAHEGALLLLLLPLPPPLS